MDTVNGIQQFNLSGRVAVVTGASSGIGQAMARALACAGAALVLIARRPDLLEATASMITRAGGRAHTLPADLVDSERLPDLARRAAGAFGPPHIVVNAAGVNLRESVDAISSESWDRTLNLNLKTPFFLSREFVPAMRNAGYGRVINIASLQSFRAFPNGLAYGASKGGVAQLTRAMAEAWSRHGITCNALAPGFFPTDLTAAVFDDPQRAKWAAQQTTIGRNGELSDLDGATVFLASPASSYITGQVISVDGGFTAR